MVFEKDTEEYHLRGSFEKCGRTETIEVTEDKQSGEGTCCVTFGNHATVDKAVIYKCHTRDEMVGK